MKIQNPYFPFGIPGTKEPILFCFHHAGGNAGQLRQWAGVKDDVAIVPVEYAGHGCRMDEEFPESIQEIANELAKAIFVNYQNRDVYVYGHSLGTLIAFETVKVLERLGVRVNRLIVAGRGAPFDAELIDFKSHMGVEALIEEMRRVGGMEEELLQDKRFMEFFSPIILHDYWLHERYEYDGSHIAAPISAHCANGDADTNLEQMSQWQQVTSGSFDKRGFEGGHFFVLESEEYLSILISEVKG